MTRHYVTACRRWQLPVLLFSMRLHCKPFMLHVLAWDWTVAPEDRGGDWCYRTRQEFLCENPRWRDMPGPPRQTIDQVATARWRFAADVMHDTGQPVTIIDGDQWFWSSPESVFAEIKAAPMAVSPHRFPDAADGLPGATVESHGKYGRFNTGWTYLADPRYATQLAEFNLTWSYTAFRPWLGREIFGDQGYVDWLQENSHGDIHIIEHPGCNVGPWNIHRYGIMKAGGRLFVVESDRPGDNMSPLVSYHYSSMRFDFDGRVRQYADPGYAVGSRQIEQIYLPYAEAVAHAGLL
jgi:hypothetical protein